MNMSLMWNSLHIIVSCLSFLAKIYKSYSSMFGAVLNKHSPNSVLLPILNDSKQLSLPSQDYSKFNIKLIKLPWLIKIIYYHPDCNHLSKIVSSCSLWGT